jgi:hypothetical protein
MSRYSPDRVRVSLALCLSLLLLTACGSEKTESPLEASPQSAGSENQGGTIATQQPEFDTSMVQTAVLPEGFPASFPIPDGAQLTSNVSLPGEDDFRVFFALVMPIEDALAYYQSELPANGWMIEEQTETGRGTEMKLISSEYEGELLFVDADTGVALDVHLLPTGGGALVPELAGDLGDSASLGEGDSSFPADFPVPTIFNPFELNQSLQDEGFELAYTYDGMAEMAMVEFNIAMMSSGWEIGDPTIDPASGIYMIPFTNPATGFQGHASILRDASGYGLEAGSVLILIAPGTP